MFLYLAPAFHIKMHEINFSFQHIIFRMDLLPVYGVKHSKHITTFLQHRKQLYTPDTCLLSLTSNKTMGHMTPFMVHLPVVDKNIIQTYPKMGAGSNSELLYVPCSATMQQNATYVHSGRLYWALYSAQAQHLLIKEIVSSCADYITWHGDHFTEMKAFDFALSPRLKSLSKFCNYYPYKNNTDNIVYALYIRFILTDLDTLPIFIFCTVIFS